MKYSVLILSCTLLVSACNKNELTEAGDIIPIPPHVQQIQKQLDDASGIRQIKRLQYAFAHYLSNGKWQDASELFSEQAQYRWGDISVSGKPEIAEYLLTELGNGIEGIKDGQLNEHIIISPVINLSEDGNSAKGRWRLVALQGQYGESAHWAGGIFENTYTRENGIWKLSDLHFYSIYGGDYQNGWRVLKEEVQEDVAPIPFHYTADESGVPRIISSSDSLESANLSEEVQVLVGSLNRQATQLLHEDAINNLQNAYGYYLDRQLWDDLADLFHEDATLQLGQIGIYKGRDSIREAMNQFGPARLPVNVINDHLQLQIVITVSANGLSAKARGTELQQLGIHDQNAYWGLATFENEYLNVDGVWQIQSVSVYPRMLTNYDQGWAENAQPAPSANSDYPGDIAITSSSQSYPAYNSPEFHFSNPGLSCDSTTDTNTCHLITDSAAGNISVQELQRKLRVLNAYEGAENVSNAYGYYIDEFMWDGMADVFAEDGWKELSYIGSYVGRERVRHSVVSRYGRGGRRANGMTYHQLTQPVITVAEDGNTARIRSRLFQLNSSTFNPGSFISGIYENQIKVENGIWKIKGMDLDYAWLANYDGGWQRVVPGSSNRFAPAPGSLQGEAAPDRPLRGLVFAPFPEGEVDMAFHYLNPVSGRKPPAYLPEVSYELLQFE